MATIEKQINIYYSNGKKPFEHKEGKNNNSNKRILKVYWYYLTDRLKMSRKKRSAHNSNKPQNIFKYAHALSVIISALLTLYLKKKK